MAASFHIRRTTDADIDSVARHRASMFLDMGSITSELVDELAERTRTYLREAVPRGEYIGWVASPDAERERIVAGAGVLIRRILPFPRPRPGRRADIGEGRQAIVLNVYTEPSYRRRGLARALMYEVMAWARATDLESLVLHAAPDGQPLYKSLGFAATNEMRFSGDLSTWTRPIESPETPLPTHDDSAEPRASRLFIEFSRWKLLDEYWPRLRSAVESLTPEQVWWRPNETSNSVGNLVLHLNGNVRQWLVASFNELKDGRHRPAEFAERQPIASAVLLDTLAATMDEASAVLSRLTEADLRKTFDIQGYTVSGLHAVYQVVEHFGMHYGQVLYITKLVCAEDLGFYRELNKTGRMPSQTER